MPYSGTLWAILHPKSKAISPRVCKPPGGLKICPLHFYVHHTKRLNGIVEIPPLDYFFGLRERLTRLKGKTFLAPSNPANTIVSMACQFGIWPRHEIFGINSGHQLKHQMTCSQLPCSTFLAFLVIVVDGKCLIPIANFFIGINSLICDYIWKKQCFNHR